MNLVNLILSQKLEESLVLLQRMEKLLQEDRQDFKRCIDGELVPEAYRQGIDAAEEKEKELHRQIVAMKNKLSQESL